MSVFLTYCDPDEKSNLTTLSISPRLLSGNDEYISEVCSKIRDFSLLLLSEIDKIDTERGDTRELKNIGGALTDITYNTIKPVCRKDDICKRIFRFQLGQKHFIPQITHIVQEFGLFLPLRINSLQYIENIEEKVNETHFMGKTPTTKFLGKRIVSGEDGTIFGMSIKEFREEKNQELDHVHFIDPLGLAHSVMLGEQKKSEYSSEFQMWLNEVYDRICTVLRLRYIDLRVCSTFQSPMTISNEKHTETYNAFQSLKREFLGKIEYINTVRESEHLKLYKEPYKNDFDRTLPT